MLLLATGVDKEFANITARCYDLDNDGYVRIAQVEKTSRLPELLTPNPDFAHRNVSVSEFKTFMAIGQGGTVAEKLRGASQPSKVGIKFVGPERLYRSHKARPSAFSLL